jgi:competence protein ComEA
MVKIFAAVLVTVVVVIVVFQFIDPSVEKPGGNSPTTLVDGSNTTGTLSCSISGEVKRAGTYVLEENTTLEELIAVAGGLTTNADEYAFNTSYLLEDKITFYIAPKYDHSDVCSMEPIVKANINKDDEEGLQVVKGIGSTVAKAIVNYRQSNGEYKRIEDLKKVSGIGNATFEKIKDYVRLRN